MSEVGPLVTSLRDLAEDVRRGELERFRAKLAKLDPDTRDLVDAITQDLAGFHPPKLPRAPAVNVDSTSRRMRCTRAGAIGSGAGSGH